MEITERQLRKLIRESFKGFFYGIEPSNTLDDIYENIPAIQQVAP